MKHKFPIWLTFFTTIGVVILISLGVWQLNRLAWKEAILTDIDLAFLEDPKDNLITDVLSVQRDPDAEIFFKRGVMSGAYLPNKTIFIGPKTHEGKIGYHVYMPFELYNDQLIWVNRGWVEDGTNPQSISVTEKSLLEGVLREGGKANTFVPDNAPDKNQWLSPIPEEMSIYATLDISKVSEYTFIAENELPPVANITKISARPAIRNAHMQYAIFWFVMAGALGIIFAILVFKKI